MRNRSVGGAVRPFSFSPFLPLPDFPGRVRNRWPLTLESPASGAGSVEQKTIDAASRSYRLNGDNDELDKLVGHQIRVSGTLADRGNLNAPQQGSSPERGTSGTMNKDRELSESDLAKVDVKSVESIADSCDSGKNGGASPSRR